MKRCIDLIASAFGLIVFSPVMLIIAVVVLLTDGRPILFCQQRVGKDGLPFTLYKFRSMRTEQDASAPQITQDGDSRITPIGRILRKTKLDELPQLINVLFGKMSMVGPRPEVQRYVGQYDDQQKRVLRLVPGITDPASLKYFNEEDLLASSENPEEFYVESIMPDKIRINLKYAQHANVISDLGIILKTVARVFSGRTDSAK
ncbi:MAG: sugar transferase [Rubripirellula sp.]